MKKGKVGILRKRKENMRKKTVTTLPTKVISNSMVGTL